MNTISVRNYPMIQLKMLVDSLGKSQDEVLASAFTEYSKIINLRDEETKHYIALADDSGFPVLIGDAKADAGQVLSCFNLMGADPSLINEMKATLTEKSQISLKTLIYTKVDANWGVNVANHDSASSMIALELGEKSLDAIKSLQEYANKNRSVLLSTLVESAISFARICESLPKKRVGQYGLSLFKHDGNKLVTVKYFD